MDKQLTQQRFDRVFGHFVHFRAPKSLDVETGGCSYRGANGSKCAFGLFIPDSRYEPDMERKNARVVCNKFFLDVPVDEEILRFFNRLQRAHDCSDNVPEHAGLFLDGVSIRLHEIAQEYDLTIPSVRQTAFNKVWQHFVVEGGKPSFSVDDRAVKTCRLRGLRGEKCAVGLLLPDEAYQPGDDVGGFSPRKRSRWHEKTKLDIFLPEHRGFLESLQSAHDGAVLGEKFIVNFQDAIRVKLETVARTNGLYVPVPEPFDGGAQ
jgi:hypothetical protein